MRIRCNLCGKVIRFWQTHVIVATGGYAHYKCCRLKVGLVAI